eukprot:CAMPEP_0194144846 /NCGR_PEP_ID=MMETSP0152-20130528/13845_1 /TAXON_ID=1049557 /ORGANISM="Thalassiothrix antarctica, Strain L6-D1" /LENGTH=941 /DNA_ID=CAMNT_0038844861 /DNA_START=358 /DNA_END=3179 /DNA_ORIENTATION=+
MASLRVQKCMRSKRYGGVVICVFANIDGKIFAPIEERQSARKQLREEWRELRSNKAGIIISDDPELDPHQDSPVVPMNETITLHYMLLQEESLEDDEWKGGLLELSSIQLTGSHKKSYSVSSPTTPASLGNGTASEVLPIQLTFRTTRIAAHRVTIAFDFRQRSRETDSVRKFRILRDVVLRSGNSKLYAVLEAQTPYRKRQKYQDLKSKPKDIIRPPKQKKKKSGGQRGIDIGYRGLGQFRIPKRTMGRIETGELEDALVPPWDHRVNKEQEKEFGDMYSKFWQLLLWASELQAYEDIRLYDLEHVPLAKKGKFFQLKVEGLAEGRPSVLKGDLVLCWWNSKEYHGRVTTVGMEEVLLEFHPNFQRAFNPSLDKVDRVRFTFTRTNFRTSHAGIRDAPAALGSSLLVPSKASVRSVASRNRSEYHERTCPPRFNWTSNQLNKEQQQAVTEIVKGSLRPLPYIIFGPPGTGKTTTMVEAIYQLAKLRNFDQNHDLDDPPNKKLKILVVAPSNDATDILVEKLSRHFPPSEMVRVLAYTRSIDQVPEAVRKYCTEGMEASEIISKILSVQITVSTINMASRLWCTGLQKGHFDVFCVDEAGHATEPEVMAVAATLMKFHESGEKRGQLVLAGDPMQLGPVVTSELCQIFKMDRSYLERLVQTSSAYRLEDNFDQYPPKLVTLLVNNYRSHPHILKLPNEMFYHNQLIAKGDVFTTHSMAKWEHLPTKGFPILFHAVDGENTREGNSPSWFNPQEAMVVVDYVQKLVEKSKPKIAPEDIGIITPYARQVQKIRIALKISGIEDVKVGSVETFQGQERQVIIISTVRSENSLLQHDKKYNLGFVANEKRFNVAVTRAKALLVVVGNPRVLETDTKNWLPLLQFCKSYKSWKGEDWDAGRDEGEEFNAANGDAEVDKDEWAAAAQEFDAVDGDAEVDKDEWAAAA